MVSDPTPFIHLCRRCSLAEGRTNVVRGEGPIPAKVMLLGEAPGELEDQQGRPFIGKSGQLLRDTLEANGINPTTCYITNSVKSHPPKNRKPKVSELTACSSWLKMEIAVVKPEVIVALGETALRALFGSGKKAKYGALGVEDARRREDLSLGGMDNPTRVLACYHPAAALRSPRFLSGFVRDIERLAELLGTKEIVDQTRKYRCFEPVSSTNSLTMEQLGQDFLDNGQGIVAIDTEYEEDGTLVCYSFSWRDGEGWCVILSDWSEYFGQNGGLLFLQDLITAANRVVFHNAKADIPVLNSYGIDIPWGIVEDTIIMAYNLNKSPLALKSLASNELGLRVIRLDEIRPKGTKIADIQRAKLVEYSAQDPDLTRRLYMKFSKELDL